MEGGKQHLGVMANLCQLWIPECLPSALYWSRSQSSNFTADSLLATTPPIICSWHLPAPCSALHSLGSVIWQQSGLSLAPFPHLQWMIPTLRELQQPFTHTFVCLASLTLTEFLLPQSPPLAQCKFHQPAARQQEEAAQTAVK